ncbi:hypothetical protein [Streptomyces yunnanensis]|uniref:Lipoprotein n=1 Tax=Streptomyces yunnanensis TaxID=156453 RepID=A0A9X8MXH4_9ACTN|nr:hypothetical protein [Streptomyces yunnanensis]SHM19830.1 hypothetical protein SAMN05216268_10989 [Streptomyces yunnanensis]
MSTSRTRTVRRATLMLACATALASLTACGPDNSTGPAGGSSSASSNSPSSGASTGSQGKPNGIEKSSAKDIYGQATRANADAGSFREQATSSLVKSDLRISATECVGKVDKLQQGSFEIIRKSNDIWTKVDAKFSEMAKAHGGALPADKWLHGTTSNPLAKALSSYCHSEQFTSPAKAATELTTGQITTVNGASAVPVGRTAEGKSVTYYVATTGKPYLLKREIKGQDRLPSIVYSDFGKPVGASAPAGETVAFPSS